MRIQIKETVDKTGQSVELAGWVDVRRDHGKLIFIDLRDESGVIQLVFTPKSKDYEIANSLRPEWVIKVLGEVKPRPENMVNADIETGKFEMPVESLEILNEAKTPPFPLDTDGLDIDEDLRLKYRYLDLRRKRLQNNLRLRSQFVEKIRQQLFANGFSEIETPMLTKSTPEGSRDFVVPSRMYPGSFFALPQSPQQYKQLLMASGFEKYFQIARCLRDEDLRSDRSFEHSQVDIEMAFVSQEDVMKTIEEMIITVFESMGKKLQTKPFPVFTYKEAVEKYGADKFDMRSDAEKEAGVLAFAWVKDFPFFEKNKEGKWTFTHNPFSHAKTEHVGDLLKGENIENILTSQYDLVCNGYEVGGGSIRAHKAEMLRAVFKIMGYDEATIQDQFGHMLEAFDSGTPPHGGIALGIERLIMILTGEQYVREVQAFPQTGKGHTSVMDAPSKLDEKQLKELKLKVDAKD